MQQQIDTNGGGGLLPLGEALGRAIQLHQSGDLEQAKIMYRNILKVLPDEVNALHFLGIAMHQSGDSAGGIELIERSIALAPQSNRYSDFGNVLLQAGRFEEATRALSRALELDPTSANAHNNLGVVMKAQKRFDEAAAAFEKALAINPQLTDAYISLGDLLVMQERQKESVAYYCKALAQIPTHVGVIKRLSSAYHALGEIDKAAEIYRQWLTLEPDNPVARHHLAAYSREAVPARAEDAYIESTFDDFADDFETKLGALNYRGPQLLAAVMKRECGNAREQFTVLDAGCGTGLCGPLIVDYAEYLIGVDLSTGMLEKAKLRNEYDALIKAELTEYLQSQNNTFDIILSADTLVYFGALEEVLAAARSALRDGGHLFFTVEALISDDAGSQSDLGYRLNSHGRYSHSEAYLQRTLGEAGFTISAIETAILRYESGHPVQCFVVSCQKK